MTVYLVDVGVLLEKEDEEFEAYAQYDKQHGYYDEDQYLRTDKARAISDCMEYVTEGNSGTYGIVSEHDVSDDVFEKTELYDKTGDVDDMVQICDVYLDYSSDGVVFSVCKKDDKIVEGFVKVD